MDSAGSKIAPIFPALFLIGFSSVIAQIVLMRELIVVYNGNEIALGVILASWLLWTAVGSGLFGRLSSRFPSPRRTVAVLELLVAIALPASIFAVRTSRTVFQVTPGEILGPGPMFVTSALVLGFFCLVSGALFAAGSRLYSDEHGAATAAATGSVYILEAAGSGVGGVILSLILIRTLPAFEIALLVSMLNLIVAWHLIRGGAARRRIVPVVVVVAGTLLWPLAGRTLETLSNRILWRSFDVVDVRNSVYGNLAVVATGDTRSVYQNGVVLFSVPDRESAEEAVHYALLQHEYPRSLLLVGGGTNGSLTEALKHRGLERIDYVELDPMILELARRHIPDEWTPVEADPRVHIRHTDGRLFLKRPGPMYDVIIFNLPDPQTAQLNRFYSTDCFEEAAKRLAPGGILSFQVRGAENYISDDLAEFLQCINKTIRGVFPRVTAIPGATIHFFAAVERGATTSDSNVLLDRLHARGVQTDYVNESFVPFRMTPERMQDLQARIKPVPGTPINRDLAPIAYYLNVALWSTQFHEGYRRLFHVPAALDFVHLVAGIVIVFVIASAVLARRRGGARRRKGLVTGYAVATMGFTTMGLEVLLLLGFQAVYGYVYHQLAIIIAAFMTGMAVGGYIALQRTQKNTVRSPGAKDTPTLLALQIAAALCPVLLVGFYVGVRGNADPVGSFVVSNVLFPALAVIAGGLGGYQFPIASNVFFDEPEKPRSNPGALYALDLAGACLGAVLLSTYLIPVFGFTKTAIAIAAVNVAPILLIAFALPAPGKTIQSN